MDSMRTLTIRDATADDLPAILDLVPQLVAFGPPPWRDADQMTRTDLDVIRSAVLADDSDNAARVCVGVENGNVLGFVHMRAAADYYTQDLQGHVADLVVAPAARGLGLGTRLLEAAENWAASRGFRQLTIAVFERNKAALDLYERRGFHREIVRLIKPL